MADRYISTTGDDTTGDGLTLETAWASLTKAAAASPSGSDVYAADGTYNEASYVSINKQLNIHSINPEQAIFKAASGTTRVVHFTTNSANSIIGDVVFDANGSQATAATFDSANSISLITFSGTKFRGGTLRQLLVSPPQHNVILRDSCTFEFSGAQDGVVMQNRGGSLGASGCIFTGTDITGEAYGLSVEIPSDQTVGPDVTISNNTINITGTNATAAPRGVSAIGCNTLSIRDNEININGTINTESGGSAAVRVNNHDITPLASLSVVGNHGKLADARYMILVGNDEEPTTPNNITTPVIAGNSFQDSDHGIICGYITGARVSGNTTRNSTIGVIGKYTTDCRFLKATIFTA